MSNKGDLSSLLKRVALRAVILFVVWKVIFHGLIVPSEFINRGLTKSVIWGTELIIASLGYEVGANFENFEKWKEVLGVIYIDGMQSVLVADACNGLELFALYVGFFICFPGPFKYKFFYSISGIPILYLVNVIREAALALNYHHFRFSFEFNHHYTYAFVVYLITFLMWRHWLNRYSSMALQKKPDEE